MGPKENIEKREEEIVDVFHILTSKFTPMATAFNAIDKYRIAVSKLSATEFKEKFETMTEANSM